MGGGFPVQCQQGCVAHFGAVVASLSDVCGWALGGHYSMVCFVDNPTGQDAEAVGAG